MEVYTEGHEYELFNFDNPMKEPQRLKFVNKVKDESDPTKLVLVHDGTTNEDVLAVLINRMHYLQSKFPCRENAIVITKLEESLMWLNKRTNDRVKRGVEGKHLN